MFYELVAWRNVRTPLYLAVTFVQWLSVIGTEYSTFLVQKYKVRYSDYVIVIFIVK